VRKVRGDGSEEGNDDGDCLLVPPPLGSSLTVNNWVMVYEDQRSRETY
jgi:hypothetical protein